jgi:hypothetical protein
MTSISLTKIWRTATATATATATPCFMQMYYAVLLHTYLLRDIISNEENELKGGPV